MPSSDAGLLRVAIAPGVASSRRSARAAALFLSSGVVLCATVGCKSTADRVAFLEELHTEDGGHALRVKRRPTVFDSVESLFESSSGEEVEYEEIENPTADCHEAIDDTRDGKFESETLAVRAVAILSRIADRDPSPLGRTMALSALGRLGRDVIPVVTPVIEPGRDPKNVPEPASGHVETIIHVHDIGPPWTHRPEIEGAANACLGATRALAAGAFATASEARAVARLLATLADFDPDPEIAGIARDGARRVGGLSIFLAIVEALRDDADSVRSEAARVAGSLRERAFVAPLGARLAEERSTEVRRTIARSLGVIGDPSAARFLAAALEEDEESVSLQVRLSLAEATGLSFPDQRAWREWWTSSGEEFEKRSAESRP